MKFNEYLRRVYDEYNEALIDLGFPPNTLQIGIYKDGIKFGKLLDKIPIKDNVIEKNGTKYLLPKALKNILKILTEKFGVTQEAINKFINKYTQGIPIFNNVIELNVISKDEIELTQEAKRAAVTASSITKSSS